VFQELQPQPGQLRVAPVLERLVFPRTQALIVAWVRLLASLDGLRWVVPAHYDAPVACSAAQLLELAEQLEHRQWAPNEGNWAYLAGIDRALLKLKVVPEQPQVG
jgi:hypothetical protein